MCGILFTIYFMLKGFKYRLYPNKEQEELINKHIGASRFVYNLSLETKTSAYSGGKINLSCFDLIKQLPDCGKVNKELTLKDREWTCLGCNTIHDRDINASINIKNFALKNYIVSGTDTKNQEELPTLVGALTLEARGSLAHV